MQRWVSLSGPLGLTYQAHAEEKEKRDDRVDGFRLGRLSPAE